MASLIKDVNGKTRNSGSGVRTTTGQEKSPSPKSRATSLPRKPNTRRSDRFTTSWRVPFPIGDQAKGRNTKKWHSGRDGGGDGRGSFTFPSFSKIDIDVGVGIDVTI